MRRSPLTSYDRCCRRKQAVRELAKAVQDRETFAVEVRRVPSPSSWVSILVCSMMVLMFYRLQ